MKIVQSFWSWPSTKKKNFNVLDRNNGGWLDKKFHYISWALSVLQFRKFYNDVELITDQYGYNLMIDLLQLPYTNVRVELDRLNGYHPDLWALGKIYTYQLQKSPFIHADGDVFIWKKFSVDFEDSPLVAQNAELTHSYYEKPFQRICEKFSFIPESLLKSTKKNGRVLSINAGVIGGNNLEFFKTFCKSSFEFVDRNQASLKDVEVGDLNIFFEQALFHSLAIQQDIPVAFLLKDVNSSFDGLTDFATVNGRTSFIHTVGNAKKDENVCMHLTRRLLLDYPEYYFRIMRLLMLRKI